LFAIAYVSAIQSRSLACCTLLRRDIVNNLDPNPIRSNAVVAASAPNVAQIEGMELDPKRIWQAIRRRLLIVLLIPALAMVISGLVTALTPRQYQAVATLQIEEKSSRVLSTDDTQPAAVAQDADRFLQTQLGLLNSKALAGQVVDSLGLAKDDRALRRLGMPASAAARLTTQDARRDALVGMVREGLTITLPRDSRIAQIAVKGRDPQLCARIANGYVRTFIYFNLQRRFQDSSYALAFLRDQLARAKQRLEESERAKVAYATQSRLVEAGRPGVGQDSRAGDISTSTREQIVNLTTALSAAQAVRIQAEQQWVSAQHTPLMSLPEVLQSSAIQALMEQKAVAEANYRKERERRKADFPAMQQASAQIRELDAQMAGIGNSIRQGFRSRYDVAAKNEQAIKAQLEQLKSTALDEEGLSIEYNILSREVDTNRTMYDGLLQRYKELSAASGVTANNITAVDAAEIPSNPVSPNLKLNLASAGLLGGLLALSLVFIREKFADKIHTAEDVPLKLGVRCLGALPSLAAGPKLVRALEDPRSALSEATVSVRALLEYLVVSEGCTSIVVTSSHPSESRLAFANGLARDFARTGRRVLLVDADLRKPSLHGMLRRSNHTGLSQVLAGECEPASAVLEGIVPGLDFLAAGPAPANPTELLSSRRVLKLLEDFGEHYGVVVFNTPPAADVADAFLIAGFVDATIVTVDANVTDTEAARTTIDRLAEVGACIAGVVLSRISSGVGVGTYIGLGAPPFPRLLGFRRNAERPAESVERRRARSGRRWA